MEAIAKIETFAGQHKMALVGGTLALLVAVVWWRHRHASAPAQDAGGTASIAIPSNVAYGAPVSNYGATDSAGMPMPAAPAGLNLGDIGSLLAKVFPPMPAPAPAPVAAPVDAPVPSPVAAPSAAPSAAPAGAVDVPPVVSVPAPVSAPVPTGPSIPSAADYGSFGAYWDAQIAAPDSAYNQNAAMAAAAPAPAPAFAPAPAPAFAPAPAPALTIGSFNLAAFVPSPAPAPSGPGVYDFVQAPAPAPAPLSGPAPYVPPTGWGIAPGGILQPVGSTIQPDYGFPGG